MTNEERERASRRLELAFDLFAAGEEMMRQTLIRKNPTATAAEIERKLNEWLRTRPGAEHGDAVGRRVSLERIVK